MAATAEQVDQSRALMEQQATARQQAVTVAVALAVARTREFDEWYSTPAIAAWALSLSRGIEAIQRNLARQIDALYAREATVMTGRPVRPVGVVDVGHLRPGVTHPGVYGRAADTFRFQQSLVDVRPDLTPPIEAAVQRASTAAETDIALAVRAQAQKVMTRQPTAPEGRRLIGYRRILHPELAEFGSCGLCIVASTRIYDKAELMPLHTGCNCLPMAVYEGADPGAIINDEDLAKFYDEAGGNQKLQLQRTRYQVNEHGELGPVLNEAGGDFRTAQRAERDDQRSRPSRKAKRYRRPS